MDVEDRDKIRLLEYHIMGNGGMGLLQRITSLEQTIKQWLGAISEKVSLAKCEEYHKDFNKRLNLLEDAQVVSKLEMKNIVTEALAEGRRSGGNVTWKVVNLLFGGGVIFVIIKLLSGA